MNSNTLSQENTTYDDEIDLRELFSVLWEAKKLIILITSFFALSSVPYALSLTNFYKSEAILQIDLGSNIRSSIGGLGGLAGMTSMPLPFSGQIESEIAIKTIESRAFLEHLITFENVLPSIMAAKGYDSESKKILFNQEIYNENNGAWVRKPVKNQQSKPSYLEAYRPYLNQISISKDKISNIINISVEHVSPIFAKEFLDLIIREANELLRNKDLRESSDAIEFLTSEIPKSSLIAMKDAIRQLLQSSLETQMMAKISTEYILKVIEPPFLPEQRSRPSRAITCILVTLAGGILAVLWVLIRHYKLRSMKQDIDL